MNHRDPGNRPRSRRAQPSRVPRAGAPRAGSSDALAAAIQGDDWERAALLLLLGVSALARTLPEGDISDLLAMFEPQEDTR